MHRNSNLDSENLSDQLSEWQHYYNWVRPHSAHNGKSPMERYFSERNMESNKIYIRMALPVSNNHSTKCL